MEQSVDGEIVEAVHFGVSDKYGTAIGFLPLVAALLVFTVGCIVWGILNIVYAVQGDFQWDDASDIITGIFKIIIGIMGTSGLVFHWLNGIHFTNVAYSIFIVSQAVALITKWLEWSLAMGGVTTSGNVKWRPSGSDQRYMVLYTLGVVSLTVVSYMWVLGWLKSAKRIVGVGGSGWEKKNYVTLLNEQYTIEASDEISKFKEKYGSFANEAPPPVPPPLQSKVSIKSTEFVETKPSFAPPASNLSTVDSFLNASYTVRGKPRAQGSISDWI